MRGLGMAVVAMTITACGRIGFDVDGVDADVRRRELVLDTATLPELTGVPVLVALDASRIDYVRAGDQANRLWFTDPDGTVIPHEYCSSVATRRPSARSFSTARSTSCASRARRSPQTGSVRSTSA